MLHSMLLWRCFKMPSPRENKKLWGLKSLHMGSHLRITCYSHLWKEVWKSNIPFTDLLEVIEVPQQRSLTAKRSHSKGISQQRSLTAKRRLTAQGTHSKCLTAKRSHSKERDLTAKKSHSKEIESHSKRSHSKEISQQRGRTAKKSHRRKPCTKALFLNFNLHF